MALGKAQGKTYGVFIKAALKGVIFYNPKLHDYSSGAPTTWDDLVSMGAANKGDAKALWCLGIAAFAAKAATRIRQSEGAIAWINRALGGLFVYLGIRVAMLEGR